MIKLLLRLRKLAKNFILLLWNMVKKLPLLLFAFIPTALCFLCFLPEFVNQTAKLSSQARSEAVSMLVSISNILGLEHTGASWLILITTVVWLIVLVAWMPFDIKRENTHSITADLICAALISVGLSIPLHLNSENIRSLIDQLHWRGIVVIGLPIICLLLYLTLRMITTSSKGHRTGPFSLIILMLCIGAGLMWGTYHAYPALALFQWSYTCLGVWIFIVPYPAFHNKDEEANSLHDEFGRNMIVEDCLQRLMNSWGRKEACNIAITGGWGTGKTFILDLMRQSLSMADTDRTSSQQTAISQLSPPSRSQKGKSKRLYQMHIISLNPWHLNTIEDIQNALFNSLSKALRTHSCLFSPSFVSILQALSNTIGQGYLIHWMKALEGLIKTPGSLDNELALHVLRQRRDLRIVVFLDDIERLGSDVLREFLALIDSLTQIPWLRFVVAINTEALLDTWSSQKEASGYFHKVFTDHIELPDIEDVYIDSFIMKYIDHYAKNDQQKDIQGKDVLKSCFERLTSAPLQERDVYYPRTPRTLIHSLQSLISLIRQPLAELATSEEDRSYCRDILKIIHFFNCLKEEDSELYYQLQRAHPQERIPILTSRIASLSSWQNANEQDPHHPELRSNYFPLLYLQHQSRLKNSTLDERPWDKTADSKESHDGWNRLHNAFPWPETSISYALDGQAYSRVLPSTGKILDVLAQSGLPKNHYLVTFGEKDPVVENFLIRIFWERIMQYVFVIPSPLVRMRISRPHYHITSGFDLVCTSIRNNRPQIKRNQFIFERALILNFNKEAPWLEIYTKNIITCLLNILNIDFPLNILKNIRSSLISHNGYVIEVAHHAGRCLTRLLSRNIPICISEWAQILESLVEITPEVSTFIWRSPTYKAPVNPASLVMALYAAWMETRYTLYRGANETEEQIISEMLKILKHAEKQSVHTEIKQKLFEKAAQLLDQPNAYYSCFESCCDFYRELEKEGLSQKVVKRLDLLMRYTHRILAPRLMASHTPKGSRKSTGRNRHPGKRKKGKRPANRTSTCT